MSLIVSSAAFAAGTTIPIEFTGDGRDVSPPLAWTGAPGGTREFAVICDDPDAPTPVPWVHWVLYKVPSDVTSLPKELPTGSRITAPVTALQGQNSWTRGRAIGYRGPAPPAGHGVHHYHFAVYALDAELDVAPGLSKHDLLAAMQPHVIATGELVGTYQR